MGAAHPHRTEWILASLVKKAENHTGLALPSVVGGLADED